MIPKHLQNTHIFGGGRWGAMSGESPKFPAQVEPTHENLVHALKGMAIAHHETSGRYEDPERSVVVYNPSREQMQHLGKMFGQESVIFSDKGKHELIYTNGVHEGKSRLVEPGKPPIEHFADVPEDMYTKHPQEGYFRVNFDFTKDPEHQGPVTVAPAVAPEQPVKKSETLQRPYAHPHSYEWHESNHQHYRDIEPDPMVKAQVAHPHHDTPAVNDQAAGVGVSSYKKFAAPYGTVHGPQKPSDLFHYDYRMKLPEIEDQVKAHGFKTYYAGGKYGKPDLANKNYTTGHLMVYDPTPGSGGDFGEETQTKGWRQIHELAHALTLPEVNKIYGEGRRMGKLGHHRTMNEAMRAVHWEWLAAHKQRELGARIGVHVPDETFHKELNTVLHDAVHRAVTGKFTEPSGEGFVPHSHKVPLATALDMVRDEASNLGLHTPHQLLTKKTEPVIYDMLNGSPNVSNDKTYTAEEVKAIVMAKTEAKIREFEAELKVLRARELKKALIPDHKHNSGTTVGAGVEDVAAGKLNPPGRDDHKKAAKEEESSSEESSSPERGPHEETPAAEESSAISKSSQNYTRVNGQPDYRGTKGPREPMGHTHPKEEHACPNCERSLGDGYSCPDCADGHDKYYMAVPRSKLKKEELCKTCGKAHEMNKCVSKAVLVDAKGRQKDNGIHPDSALPEDKKPKKVNEPSKGDAGSGGVVSAGKSLASIKKAALTKSLLKAEPPMAKPPGGKNMSTHVPVSKPQAAVEAPVGGPKSQVPDAPGMKKEALGGDGVPGLEKGVLSPDHKEQAKAHMVSDAARAHQAPPEAKKLMPSPAEHEARAAGFAQKPGIFGKLQAKGLVKAGIDMKPKVLTNIPKLKPKAANYPGTLSDDKTDSGQSPVLNTPSIPAPKPVQQDTNPGRPSSLNNPKK